MSEMVVSNICPLNITYLIQNDENDENDENDDDENTLYINLCYTDRNIGYIVAQPKTNEFVHVFGDLNNFRYALMCIGNNLYDYKKMVITHIPYEFRSEFHEWIYQNHIDIEICVLLYKVCAPNTVRDLNILQINTYLDIMNYPKRWSEFFTSQLDELNKISNTLSQDIQNGDVIYPKLSEIYKAFELVDMNNIKVIILGLDPYHEPNQAMGLSFSVNKGIKIPSSLQNIFKELKADGFTIQDGGCGDLTKWSNEGVLLLNTALTVKKGMANSYGKLWHQFTNNLLNYINHNCQDVICILWGKQAESFKTLLTNQKILTSAHPSGLSAHKGFFGSSPFLKTNKILKRLNKTPIDWNL